MYGLIELHTTIVIFGFLSMTDATIERNIEDENVPLSFTEAVQGMIARLPCNITPSISDDRASLVIWYKEGYATPLYSFDARNLKSEKGLHWMDEKNFGGRAKFNAATRPAMLTVESSKSSDAGIYRCRVDFHKSPTRNARVQLKILIPPEKLLILDEKGTHIPHYILGPYNEGASINITCVSTGGRPLPNVTWWHENTLLDSTAEVLSERRVKNILHLDKLQRTNLHMVLTCQAANNNVTTPISSSVTLDMNLRALWVKLQGENRPLSADTTYDLYCEVVGSRPKPLIAWWKGSTPMRNTREIVSADGNVTQSILSFTPSIHDRGKFLSCRAENSLIPDSGRENGWKLDIYHIPVVSLEFGTNLNTTSLREGVDVYFECNVKSNPWVYKVSWRHNGKILDNNPADGIIVANQSLVLQNASRARSGLYTCIGSNREGDGESNAVQLDIKFAPICRPGQVVMYSVSRQESARISCELEANPTDVTFKWRFNATQTESLDLPSSLIVLDKAKSVVVYTPMTEHDYGTLLCSGSNEIGVQIEPCIFNIIPAGKPDPLSNCTIINQTFDTFEIECNEGFDGGLSQEFLVQVYTIGSLQMITEMRSKIPFFQLRGLYPGYGYDIQLAAFNKKGNSPFTQLQGFTLKNPEKQTDQSLAYSPTIENMKPFLATLLGIVGGLIFIATIIVLVVRMRGSSGRDRNNCMTHTIGDSGGRNSDGQQPNSDGLPSGGTIGGGIMMASDTTQTTNMHTHTHGMAHHGHTVTPYGHHDLHNIILLQENGEKNPDLIPQGKKQQPSHLSIDEREEDERAFQWINSANPRMYATAALAEQNSLPLSQQPPSSTQHLIQKTVAGGGSMMSNYGVMPHELVGFATHTMPVTSLGYNPHHKTVEVSYGVACSRAPPPLAMYSSATLGRPRHVEFKRPVEPQIFSQIDLAHHHNVHMLKNGNGGGGGGHALRAIPFSHSSQMTAFPPPPLFSSTASAAAAAISNSSGGGFDQTIYSTESKKGMMLPTLPEMSSLTSGVGAAAAGVARGDAMIPTIIDGRQPAAMAATQNDVSAGKHATRF